MKINKILLFISLNLFLISADAIADTEYYGVEWDQDEIDKLGSYGYDPKKISMSMYDANDQCSKTVKNVDKEDQFVCIEFRCGLMTWSYVIDTYREQGKVKDTGTCYW